MSMEGRKILEKNAFLIGLEEIMKDAGIIKLGCYDSFDGTKGPGKRYVALGTHEYTPVGDVEWYVDPTSDAEDYDGRDICRCYRAMHDIDDSDVIYMDGTFYER